MPNNQTKKFNILKLLLLLVPPVFTFLFSIILMPMTDSLYVTTWHIALMILGFAVLPLTFMLFKDFSSGGYFLSKTIGILLLSTLVWTFTYIGVCRFNKLFLIIILAAVTVFCYAFPPLLKNTREKIFEDKVIRNILIEELIFSFVFVLLCFFKGMYPDIEGQEKYMDFGFIMSMLRSDKLPANDMWLAGQKINYYYFGQFIYALIIKLFGFNPNYGYMLSMCTAIAIPFGSAYTVGTMLIEFSRKKGFEGHPAAKYICGGLCAFTAIIFGNSHSFFYDEDSLGNSFLRMLANHGIDVGQTDGFFYPDSTRFIGWNPDSKVYDEMGKLIDEGDFTIHEFPFYSYLVGDLHAHVISMMVVILIIAVAIALLYKAELPTGYELSRGSVFGPSKFSGINKTSMMHELKLLNKPEIFVIGLLLGVAQMTNYWDFLIYFIFSAMTLLIFNTVRSKSFIYPTTFIAFALDLGLILITYMTFADRVVVHVLLQILLTALAYILVVFFPSALTRTALAMNVLFSLAYILAMPFNMKFDLISNALAKVTHRSAIWQLMILWGVHVLICVIFIVYTIISKNYIATKKKNKTKVALFNQPFDGYTNPVSKFFGERNLCDIFICGMSITGFLMLIAPEIFYVRDIYTGGYLRSNTMFKFTFAGFIMLSIAIGYIVIRLFWFANKEGNFSFPAFSIAIFCAVLLLVPAHYTILSLEQRSGDLKKSNFKTLDGTQYLTTFKSGDIQSNPNPGNLLEVKNCIDWMNENIDGSPTICEAYGTSYTSYNLVSSYTGLPTVFGWQTHEWLWRFHGIVDEETDLLVPDPDQNVFDIYINPRHADIDTIYTSTDGDLVWQTLMKYDVRYIVVGPFEREKYGGNLYCAFTQYLEPVYFNSEVAVYKTY